MDMFVGVKIFFTPGRSCQCVMSPCPDQSCGGADPGFCQLPVPWCWWGSTALAIEQLCHHSAWSINWRVLIVSVYNMPLVASHALSCRWGHQCQALGNILTPSEASSCVPRRMPFCDTLVLSVVGSWLYCQVALSWLNCHIWTAIQLFPKYLLHSAECRYHLIPLSFLWFMSPERQYMGSFSCALVGGRHRDHRLVNWAIASDTAANTWQIGTAKEHWSWGPGNKFPTHVCLCDFRQAADTLSSPTLFCKGPRILTYFMAPQSGCDAVTHRPASSFCRVPAN